MVSGSIGPQGLQGVAGTTGATGATGPAGADVSTSLLKLGTVTQTISSNGEITAANSFILVAIGNNGNNLSNITNGTSGTVIVLQAHDPNPEISINIASNQQYIRLYNNSPVSLTGYSTLQLIYRNNLWIELSRTTVDPPPPTQKATLSFLATPHGVSVISAIEASVTISAPGTYSLIDFVVSNNSSRSLTYTYSPVPSVITFNSSVSNGITITTMTIESGNPQSFDITVYQNPSYNYLSPDTVTLHVNITI
jgi:hypothetical protein